ncbi:V-type ATP synthase subunit E [Streptomyces hirsutus]|uniref:V-type ATP synthase subunit E n=1 Tax=Streptomyces hirsutus TaxID=35620 RepID=A0ABZ1GI51_9ACTN|nr:V-type ATP synthase subunit E [Streptomyces hirsutus]WSD04967.1 V-type ATP synthase subunit E [Streptomyces hirsutus]WTD21640.1 V-type ATP synthase subunit E [Streptomyces hirsutus]
MKSPAPDHLPAALEPVRDRLLRAARTDAEELLARADREAEALLDEARAQAAAILDDARHQGETDATQGRTAELTRVRRTIRARELGVRRQAYEELCRRATERVRGLRNTADYPAIRDRLHRRARQLLGPDAELAEHPGGGFVAQAPGRRVDCTLDALAARALDRLGAEAESLWAP